MEQHRNRARAISIVELAGGGGGRLRPFGPSTYMRVEEVQRQIEERHL